jgi:hypothetical protein
MIRDIGGQAATETTCLSGDEMVHNLLSKVRYSPMIILISSTPVLLYVNMDLHGIAILN